MKSLVLGFLFAVFIFGTFIGGVAIVAAAVAPSFAYQGDTSDLSSKDALMNRNNTGLILLDRNGQEFFRFYQARRASPLPLAQFPQNTRDAVLAAEDKRFYSHTGFSWQAIVASLLANYREGENAYGGSTITQQLAKSSFLNPEKTLQRKVQELLLAQDLERLYTKDEILEMYMNSVYVGEGAFGFEEASHAYFSKGVQELTLPESALLAGILTAPSIYSPLTGNREAAISRQRTVLQEMAENGYIDSIELTQALTAPLTFTPEISQVVMQAPHFAEQVRKQLIQQYGEEALARSGYVVKTTLDPAWQTAAEAEVSARVTTLARNKVSNGAAVVIEPKSGEVRALVGSKDWNEPTFGKFDVATSPRQPGSSFKPIVYLSALEAGIISPSTITQDTPKTFGGSYRPVNYDGRYRGRVSIRRALANSLNIPAVDTQQKVGVPATLNMASRLGITNLTTFSPNDLSLSLGSGEVSLLQMTNAYSTFARLGEHLGPAFISSITDKQNAIIYSYAPEPQRVVDSSYSFLLTSMLSDNSARREVFGSALTVSRPAAVKTGTTNDYKDSWTIGYTPSLAVGIWVGNNDSSPMDNVAGSLGAAPIWRALIEKFSVGSPVERFERPSSVQELTICRWNGLKAPAGATGPNYTKELFAQGVEPGQECRPENSLESSPSPTPSLTIPDTESSELLPPPSEVRIEEVPLSRI